MTLLELTLETAIKEAGEYKDVRLSKEDTECVLALLKEQEAIVRCMDCKYRNAPANGVPFCKRIKKFVDADWFCADGERR